MPAWVGPNQDLSVRFGSSLVDNQSAIKATNVLSTTSGRPSDDEGPSKEAQY